MVQEADLAGPKHWHPLSTFKPTCIELLEIKEEEKKRLYDILIVQLQLVNLPLYWCTTVQGSLDILFRCYFKEERWKFQQAVLQFSEDEQVSCLSLCLTQLCFVFSQSVQRPSST